MTTHSRPGRRIGWGLTGLAATVAVITAGAPAASADIMVFNIDPAGQTYYVGTNYRLRAITEFGDDFVSFYDNGQCIGSSVSKGNAEVPTAPIAGVYWIPSTAGHHVITANDGKSTMTITLDIQPAPAGSTPATPQPQLVGCSQIDRLLTGSS
ncbi:hypothetical protein ACIRRA_45840 [Nocardia sp. NPDC101769]|uniref:hypothetical protein n=1 Tax=Nocardia sp. NPDC101769 TaxID=3364333 RepID=UPI003829D8C0